VGRIIGIAAVMAVLAAIAPGQFGGSAKKDGPLRWQAPARTSQAVGGTGDHLLFGRVVNHSDRTLRLRAADVHVLDRDGHRLDTRAAFADGFVPGVTLSGYGAEMYGADAGSPVGRQIVLRTGQAAPLTASFTAGDGRRAAMIDYGPGRLKLG
jgi:nitrous oxidase accessory protein NosD